MTGRAGAKTFSSYHQLLNRARRNPRVMARHLPGMVVNRLVPDGPVVIAIDDTIERRWGRRITARGICRDPVRSSHGHFVKAISTDTAREPADIIALFVRRWQVEVTFAETRAHLGVETQRQWSDKAIARTTPALLGLYSLISLWACDLLSTASMPYAAAWYRKTSLTFTDAIACVRLALWVGDIFQHSAPNRKPQEIPPDRIVRMAEALCFAA
jgi:hypothetical protein